MNKTELINRVNLSYHKNQEMTVFFSIEGMNNHNTEEVVMDLIKDLGIKTSGNVVLKYDGISVDMKVEKIPELVKKLVENNINIYSVYPIYDPYI